MWVLINCFFLQVLRREANSFNSDLDSSTPYTELNKPQNHPPMTQYELVQARRYLQQDVLTLRRVEGISSSTMKIVWEVSACANLRIKMFREKLR